MCFHTPSVSACPGSNAVGIVLTSTLVVIATEKQKGSWLVSLTSGTQPRGNFGCYYLLPSTQNLYTFTVIFREPFVWGNFVFFRVQLKYLGTKESTLTHKPAGHVQIKSRFVIICQLVFFSLLDCRSNSPQWCSPVTISPCRTRPHQYTEGRLQRMGKRENLGLIRNMGQGIRGMKISGS